MKDRTVTEHAETSAQRSYAPRPGVLVVFARHATPARAVEIGSEGTVGRDDGVAVKVDDYAMSRRHARLSRSGDGFHVEDLGSRNGTFVNGTAVPSGGAPAPPGSVIRLAGTLLLTCADVTPHLASSPTIAKDLIGGAALDDVRTRVRTIAATPTPVLILGETGSGKELVARAIHEASGRRGDLVALNCAAVPPELMDAELFGHGRGAFSGASGARVGLFRAADGGTLFLDEIGELPGALQAKLLRALETSEVRPVGEDRAVRIDVRVVAATNRDVDEMVDAGGFRGDLLFRLAGMRIPVPALRHRIEDVPALAASFLQPLGVEPTAGAIERLMLMPWPGNVRELKNALVAAAAVARDRASATLTARDVGAVVAPRVGPGVGAGVSGELHDALTAAAGNVAAAAERLGMSRSTLYETLKRLGINAKSYRR